MTDCPRRLRGATLLLGILVAACAPGDNQPGTEEVAAGLPAGHPAIGAMGAPGTVLTGVVKETMDGGGYTFALLDTGDREIWVAGPQAVLSVGLAVSLPDTMNMGPFTAPSLDRTFDLLYFTGKFSTPGPTGAASMEFEGTVKESIDAGGYTYVLVAAEGTEIWLAAPEGVFEAGQTVAWNGGLLMPNFHSSSLDRTFETLYFVENVAVVTPEG